MSDELARIAAMKAFADQFPDNPFPRYALAMEHKGAGRFAEAAEALSELSRRIPAYVPTWLMYGQVLEELGRTEDARATYVSGLDAARAKGDRHAESELQAALDAL